jgi:hypothetical protein
LVVSVIFDDSLLIGYAWHALAKNTISAHVARERAVPHNGTPACHYCDQCQRGCFTASYFNSPSVTLPAAARTGRFKELDYRGNSFYSESPGCTHYSAPQ